MKMKIAGWVIAYVLVSGFFVLGYSGILADWTRHYFG